MNTQNITEVQTSPQQKERLDSIDGLKVLFTLLIFLHHYWGGVTNYGTIGIAPFEPYFHKVYQYGFFGVEFFFFASGFMISFNYREKIRNQKISSFIIKRLIKIYPVAAFSVIIGFCLSTLNLYGGYHIHLLDKPVSIFHFIASMLLINNGWFMDSFNAYGSGTWFLNVLLLCYASWALIFKKVKSNRIYNSLCILMAVIGSICILRDSQIPFLFVSSGRGYLCFFTGCLMCEFYKKHNILMQCAIVVIGAVLTVAFHNIYLCFSLCITSLLFIVALYIYPIKKFLSLRFFQKTIGYTMSMYLTHGLVLGIALILAYKFNFLSFLQSYGGLLFLFATCVGVAILTYQFIEEPSSKFLRRKLAKVIAK